jgi:hypothetical protein
MLQNPFDSKDDSSTGYTTIPHFLQRNMCGLLIRLEGQQQHILYYPSIIRNEFLESPDQTHQR